MYLIFSLIFIFSVLNILCDDQIIDLNSYKHPLPHEEHDFITIAIVGTNDLHGAAFPKLLVHPITKKLYLYGGLEYMSSYINIIKDDFKKSFLWLDAGDQFQGTIENSLSQGEIMTDFFNTASLDASTIGNHEFDFGEKFLTTRMNSSSFDYLVSNIYDNMTDLPFNFPHSQLCKLYKVGKIKVGVIGLTTKETPRSTSGNVSALNFLDYKDIVINLSTNLRKNKADIVLLTSHIGVNCPDYTDEKMELKIRNISTPQAECNKEDEMYKLLDSLPTGVIDGVVGGHVHDVVHHWFNGIPTIQSTNGGFYFNVIYFTFNKKKEIVNTRIEGPIPVCEKIFENIKKCSALKNQFVDLELKNFRFHDRIIKPDNKVSLKFEKWTEKVKPYKEIIAYTEIDLIGEYGKEHALGDITTDVIKEVGNADVAILNEGALRTFWMTGPITREYIYNMFPFNNIIVTVEMTGEELKKTLHIIQSGKKSFYPTSGVCQNVTTLPTKSLINVKFYNNVEIDDKKTYVVATIDFLLKGKGGDDFVEVLNWYTLRNYKEIAKLYESLIDKLKNRTIKDDIIDNNNRRITILNTSYPKFLN